MDLAMSSFYEKHFKGAGGISELWRIAFPMIISSSFDVLIMFIDRLFLARVEPVQMAAMMTGGLTAFTAGTFFIGLLGYSGAMIAHLYGAGRLKDCSKMFTQSLILSIISYPLVLSLIPLCIASFRWAGHSPEQIGYETEYFMITIVFTTLFTLMRAPFGSFFSGIGRTSVIMIANFAGLSVNVVFAFLLIFGKFGFSRMGIRGAAVAVAAGSVANLAVLVCFYFGAANRTKFNVMNSFAFEWTLMKRLLRFGFPSGLEFAISLSAFTTMVTLFHGYGEKAASAVTIAFNWDMIAFLPMIGLQIAVTTLVGQSLGRKDEAGAIRSTWSGLKINLLYSGFMLILFLSIPSYLVKVFEPSVPTPGWNEIAAMAVPMIMMMSVYPISDGMFIVFSGAIRGAGDTTWAMAASAILHWGGALYVYVLTHVLQLPPVTAWTLFVLIFPLFGLTFWLRFRSGKWKGRNVIPDEELPLVPEPTPAIPNE
jgi:MATE family multidrug resistance protein